MIWFLLLVTFSLCLFTFLWNRVQHQMLLAIKGCIDHLYERDEILEKRDIVLEKMINKIGKKYE